MPPSFLFARHPAGASVSPRAVTYRGVPSRNPRPFRWQRSSGASAETNDGRHRGAKLYAAPPRVQRHEKVVLTNQSWSAAHAISWMWMSPVKCDSRGTKQASCLPGGSSRRAAPGRSGTRRP